MELIAEVFLDTELDLLKLLPFLFLTYLLMEYLEHRASLGTEKLLGASGKAGPLAGALLGVFPQCGFSASAAGLYSGGIISAGTLAAVFLSTSDEMLPILIPRAVGSGGFGVIWKILAVKVLSAVALGFGVDIFLKLTRRKVRKNVSGLCEHEHCHCDKGILRSALSHTLKIGAFIAAVTLAMNFAVALIGEDALGSLLTGRPFLGPVLAALVGLIPNCAASVVITELGLSGVLSAGATVGGLMTGSGVGLLVLFRTNRPMKENALFALFLFAAGAICGVLLDLGGFTLTAG